MPNRNQDFGQMIVNILQIVGETLVLLIKILYTIISSLISIVIPKQPKSVHGEIVLITGGGHGIGKELSLLYANEGATVVIWDINEENGQKTVAEIAKLGHPRAYFYKVDVSNHHSVKEAAERLRKEIGDVTILINNAGIMPTHPLLEHSHEEIQRIIGINVMGQFWTLEAFLPIMKQNNYGHIVSLSSTAGLFGLANLVPYCTSKFAVRGLMEALSEELRTDKRNEIKLTSIYPFMVNTGLCKKPYIRFENLMPIVDVKQAASEIMYAQRHNIEHHTIPGDFRIYHIVLQLLPRKAQIYAKDFLGVGLHSDLN